MSAKQAVKRVVPRSTVDKVQRFRRNHMALDIHQSVTPVMLEHVGRYVFAANWCTHRRVLDAACGGGFGSALLDAGEYVGLDLDGRAVSEARHSYPRYDFRRGSVFDLPFGDGIFGTVVSFETLEHVPTPELALVEFARVLREDGVLVGSVPVNHPERVFHVRPYSADEIVGLVDDSPLAGGADWFVQDGWRVRPVSRDEALTVERGTLLFVVSRS